MVFGHKRGQGYPWDGLVVLWNPSDFLALYDGNLGVRYGFFYADVISDNRTVPDLIILDGLFKGLCERPSY